MKRYYVIVVITGLTGGRSTMERDIKDKVYDGLEYLHSRADFWRQRDVKILLNCPSTKIYPPFKDTFSFPTHKCC
jgi:hypothetical protein